MTSVLVADAGFNRCVWNSSPDWLRLAVSQSSAITFVQDSKFSSEQEGMGTIRRNGMSVGMRGPLVTDREGAQRSYARFKDEYPRIDSRQAGEENDGKRYGVGEGLWRSGRRWN